MQKDEYRNRIAKVAKHLDSSNQDLLLVTPGADLRYLIGYDAHPLERLTCLAIHRSGVTWLVVPTLERPSAVAHGIEDLGIHLVDWQETKNPYEILTKEIKSKVGKNKKILVNNLMWVENAFKLSDALGTQVNLAEQLVAQFRSVKTQFEVDALHEAGQAIDNVHNQIHQWLRPGRTEREVGRDIANAIIESGHSRVDFVIVGSGPNGASPHHEVSDRVINVGEPVVVDIGGTMPSGYCSDSTRMYVIGKAPEDYYAKYEVLKIAQAAASKAAIAGVSCESIDATARDILQSAGLGDYFIHRTGHGIGLETHEDPYIVSGNKTVLQNGHAFSIEPGFYVAEKYGARIEDILVCSDGVAVSTNKVTKELVEL